MQPVSRRTAATAAVEGVKRIEVTVAEVPPWPAASMTSRANLCSGGEVTPGHAFATSASAVSGMTIAPVYVGAVISR